jgi:hypothetical protein
MFPTVNNLKKCYNYLKRNAYRILMENPEEKRPLGRPKCSLVNTIKMYLREIG